MTTTQSGPAETTVEGQVGAAIRESVGRTLAQICNKMPAVTEGPKPLDGEGISAAISCEGDLNFTLVLSVPKNTVSPLMKTFTGVPIGWDADVLHDVIGELLNVLAGDIVAELGNCGIHVHMALPRVERTLDRNRLVPGAEALVEFGLKDVHGSYRVAALATGGAG